MHSPRKPKTKPSYEVVKMTGRSGDEEEAKAAMRVIEVIQPGIRVHADKAYRSQIKIKQ